MMKKIEERRRYTDPVNSDAPYFDPETQKIVLKVFPGHFLVTKEPSYMLSTTLGSCVSACIRDPYSGIGGMNHFMLPYDNGRTSWGGSSSEFRYGTQAMAALIKEVTRYGCPKKDLEVKVFGGANVTSSTTLIGTNNSKFVLEYLRDKGLTINAQDLGGKHARRIHYFPSSGKVNRLILRRVSDDIEINAEEKSYHKEIINTGFEHNAKLLNA